MVYVVDLDDTLVLTKNLNNDAYNFALELNGHKRIKTTKRLTRQNLKIESNEKLIADKQTYFTQKWLKYRVVVNEELLKILKNQNSQNCYLWTSADKNRVKYLLKELDLAKYFNQIIFDDKKDLNNSLKRLKDITKSNVFIIFEDSYALCKEKGVIYIGKDNNQNFTINTYFYQQKPNESGRMVLFVMLKVKSEKLRNGKHLPF